MGGVSELLVLFVSMLLVVVMVTILLLNTSSSRLLGWVLRKLLLLVVSRSYDVLVVSDWLSLSCIKDSKAALFCSSVVLNPGTGVFDRSSPGCLVGPKTNITINIYYHTLKGSTEDLHKGLVKHKNIIIIHYDHLVRN